MPPTFTAVTPAQVAAVRKAMGTRRAPWTLGELLPTIPTLLTNAPEWKVTASHNADAAANALGTTPGARWDSGGPQAAGMWLQVELPRAVTSLDRPIGDEDGATIGDMVAAPAAEPLAELDVSLRNEALERALGELPERDAEVLRLRFGLGEQEPQTLADVGRALGVSRERVRQIESAALRRLAEMRELSAELREAA